MSKKPREGQKVKTTIKHEFTQDEFKAKTLEMNRLARLADLKEEERASAAATSKAEIKSLLTQVTDIRNQLDDGGEQITVDAVAVMDRKKGNKTLYRFCPGQPGHDEKLKVENMTEQDYDLLPMPDVPPETPQPKPEDATPQPETSTP